MYGVSANQAHRNRGGQGAMSPQILVDQLSLFQQGGQIMPMALLLIALPDFETFLRLCCQQYIDWWCNMFFGEEKTLEPTCLNFQDFSSLDLCIFE